jgi:hypothetical protein
MVIAISPWSSPLSSSIVFCFFNGAFYASSLVSSAAYLRLLSSLEVIIVVVFLCSWCLIEGLWYLGGHLRRFIWSKLPPTSNLSTASAPQGAAVADPPRVSRLDLAGCLATAEVYFLTWIWVNVDEIWPEFEWMWMKFEYVTVNSTMLV